MKNKEQLLNKENWIQYLNLADSGGLTNNAKANDIVFNIKQVLSRINYKLIDDIKVDVIDISDYPS